MTAWPEHIAATTSHVRRGGTTNAFRYNVDYVLIDPDAAASPRLFSRNRFNLLSVHDRDHGGAPGLGNGVTWARDVFSQHGLGDVDISLLTQPSVLGYVFNPVSFWFAMNGNNLLAVIAEVNNTYGDRHSYICAKPDLSPIEPQDKITVGKKMHVSPFQVVSGDYAFNFDIRPENIAIRIDFQNDQCGLIATLRGPRRRLTHATILRALLRRPAGALRTSALIYWQALRLKLKGVRFRERPTPPNQEVS